MNITLAVAQKIKDERTKRQYSQDYMAFKLNRSQNSYSKIELGRSKITVEQLYKISEIFELDPIHFLV